MALSFAHILRIVCLTYDLVVFIFFSFFFMLLFLFLRGWGSVGACLGILPCLLHLVVPSCVGGGVCGGDDVGGGIGMAVVSASDSGGGSCGGCAGSGCEVSDSGCGGSGGCVSGVVNVVVVLVVEL